MGDANQEKQEKPAVAESRVEVVVHDDEPGEVVRRRRPGFKLVNGGWVRDPTTGKGAR
jgi:hypothetical protein